MKMIKTTKLFAGAFLMMGIGVMAQGTELGKVEIRSQATEFYKTAPISSFPKAIVSMEDRGEAKDGRYSLKRSRYAEFLKQAGESPTNIDPLIQQAPQNRVGREPIVNFDGNNLQVSPPDPSGAVGPNHVVEMTNGLWTVYDKEGNIAPGFPKDIDDPLGGTSVSADPIVLYDREADRWVITKFNLPDSGNQFRIAVSETSDPTGAYFVYLFQAGSNNDYLKWGIYGNSYISSGNFSPTGRIYLFDREAILSGDPDAQFIGLTMPGYISGTLFQSPLTAHSEGAGIASGKPTMVWFQDNAWSGVSSDSVNLWEIDIDWEFPEDAEISEPFNIELAPFDSFIAGTGGDAFANLEQPGTSQRIDALVHVLNFQALRYDFGTHESMVINFPIEVTNGSKISGLRWVELRRAPEGEWELYQEGTYIDPVGDESVFMGSIGMDQEGNIAMAYIKTGDTTFPSLFYTGRGANDALGQMTVAETLIVEGTTSTNNSRYGDYAQLSRDPSDDLTFWFAAEYSGTPRRVRIASFKISDLLTIDELQASDEDFTIITQDQEIFQIGLATDTTNDILRLSVYNTLGQRVVYEQVAKDGDAYRTTLNMGNMATGAYIVTLGNAKTKLSRKIVVR